MTRTIITPAAFNALTPADQLEALRQPAKREHNWHAHNLNRLSEPNRRLEAMVEYNASLGIEEGEILFALPSKSVNWR